MAWVSDYWERLVILLFKSRNYRNLLFFFTFSYNIIVKLWMIATIIWNVVSYSLSFWINTSWCCIPLNFVSCSATTTLFYKNRHVLFLLITIISRIIIWYFACLMARLLGLEWKFRYWVFDLWFTSYIFFHQVNSCRNGASWSDRSFTFFVFWLMYMLLRLILIVLR